MRKLFQFSSSFSTSLPPFDYTPTPYTGKSYQQILQDRHTYVPSFCTMNFKKPLLITQGKMQYLYNHQGRRFQDWTSGMSTISVGHSHSQLISEIQKQYSKLGHISQILLGEKQAEYAYQLCKTVGPQFDSVYFCNSGGQAIDFAIQLAKLYTHNNTLLSLRNGYHGMVGSAGNTTNIPNWVSSITRVYGHEKLAWPSKYRGVHKTVSEFQEEAKQVIQSSTIGKVAGILIEPIQGAGGIVEFVEGYHNMIENLVRSKGGLIIADEVQTGFGRIGRSYWGFRYFNMKPDIVVLAKGIGNGIPFSAVVTRRQIAKALSMNFLNTTGGGNVQCVAGAQVLKILESQKLPQNAEKIGNYLINEFKKIKQTSKILGDVRGRGCFIGLQFVKNKLTKQPAPDVVPQIMQQLMKRQVLVGRGGHWKNVIRILPPLCMSMKDAQYFIEQWREVLPAFD